MDYPRIIIPCYGYSTAQQLLKLIWSEAKMEVRRVYGMIAGQSKGKPREIPNSGDLFSAPSPTKFSKLDAMLRQLMSAAFGSSTHEVRSRQQLLELHRGGDCEESDEGEGEGEFGADSSSATGRSSPVYLLVLLDRLDEVLSLDGELYRNLLSLSVSLTIIGSTIKCALIASLSRSAEPSLLCE